MKNTEVKLVECPRDAMQGLHDYIPAEIKIEYITQLLKVGFDTLDFGSFVSPKAIPQMRDTAEVTEAIDLSNTKTKLLAIVANQRGAESAVEYSKISYLGFPFSISETFQQRNTNTSIETSLQTVKDIQKICADANKKLVVYISMAFGNPYGDAWNTGIAKDWCRKLFEQTGADILALSDTIGVSNPQNIRELFSDLIPALPQVEFGAHLHSTPETVIEKVEAAYQSGCRRFDGAIKGFGGCPMAKDDLTGNMPTELMVQWFNQNNIGINIDEQEFQKSITKAIEVFPK